MIFLLKDTKTKTPRSRNVKEVKNVSNDIGTGCIIMTRSSSLNRICHPYHVHSYLGHVKDTKFTSHFLWSLARVDLFLLR